MPIRLRPNYNLKPCVLDLSSIEQITNILIKHFPNVKFSANRGALQIFDEPRNSFIENITKYDSIESFHAKGEGNIDGGILNIEMIFDEEHAIFSFEGGLEHENWIEHFVTDVKKQLRNPSLHQRIKMFFKEGFDPNNPYKNVKPYCKFALKQKKPSLLVENIKGNILSNILWVIAGVVIGYAIKWLF